MAYKKYHYRGGKRYGPYYYESYRDETGKVRKRYIGSVEEDKKPFHPTNFKLILLIFLALSAALIFFLFYNPQISGRASLDVQESYVSGDNISGNLVLNLRQGELIPSSSKIIISQNGLTQEFFLSDLIAMNNNGSYYAENQQISGQGEGYGFPGTKTIYPEVFFTLKISSAGEEVVGGESNNTPAESPVPNQTAEQPAESAPVTPEATPSQELTPTPQPAEQPAQPPAEQPSQETPAQEPAQSPETTITGATVKESAKEIEGQASRGNDFTYSLEAGETAGIKQGSVRTENKSIDESNLKLGIENNLATISTDYSETEEGFGQDFLGEKSKVKIDLSRLNIPVQSGTLKISLVYENITLAETSREIGVENITKQNITEENITITNETIVNMTIINETISNITLKALNITTKQYKAVIGKPVKWLKTVKSDNISGLEIEIPKSAENITIKTGGEALAAVQDAENSEQAVNSTARTSLLTGNIISETSNNGLLTRILRYFRLTGNIISENELGITETSSSKIVDVSGVVSENVSEIAIEYYTQAPEAVEENISGGKKNYNFSS